MQKSGHSSALLNVDLAFQFLLFRERESVCVCVCVCVCVRDGIQTEDLDLSVVIQHHPRFECAEQKFVCDFFFFFFFFFLQCSYYLKSAPILRMDPIKKFKGASIAIRVQLACTPRKFREEAGEHTEVKRRGRLLSSLSLANHHFSVSSLC